MDWFDKLGQFPILQFAAAIPIIAIGLVAIRKAMQAKDSGGGEATVPVSTLYLREICETLKRIEALLTPQRRPRR